MGSSGGVASRDCFQRTIGADNRLLITEAECLHRPRCIRDDAATGWCILCRRQGGGDGSVLAPQDAVAHHTRHEIDHRLSISSSPYSQPGRQALGSCRAPKREHHGVPLPTKPNACPVARAVASRLVAAR